MTSGADRDVVGLSSPAACGSATRAKVVGVVVTEYRGESGPDLRGTDRPGTARVDGVLRCGVTLMIEADFCLRLELI